MTDPTSKAKGRTAIAGLWTLLWHSVVLLPVMVAIFAVWCHALIGLVALPVAAGVFLCEGDWPIALLCGALWPVCLVCVRWFWHRERTERGGHGWM